MTAPLLHADLQALQALGKQLTGTAADIASIPCTGTVTMPNSPIGDIAPKTNTLVTQAYRHLAGAISAMGGNTVTNATTYQDTEAAFTARLNAYEAGR